jgi:hypothetical protein
VLIPFTISNPFFGNESSLERDEFLICPAHPFRSFDEAVDWELWRPVMTLMHVGYHDLSRVKSDIGPIIGTKMVVLVSMVRMYAEKPLDPINDSSEFTASTRSTPV